MVHKRKKGAFQRMLALLLSLALLGSTAAIASEALGSALGAKSETIGQGLTFTEESFHSATYSDYRREQLLEYTPNSGVVPVVEYGDYVLSRTTLSTLASRMEASGERVVAGINGDFYVLATGAPLGILVTDGVVRSSSSYHYAVGFRADGSIVMGQPSTRVSAEINGEYASIYGGINKVRTAEDGLFLYTADFAATTLLTADGVEVVLRPIADENGGGTSLKIGQTVNTEVVEVRGSGTNAAIPADCFILTIHENGDETLKELLASAEVGSQVPISISCTDTAWNDVEYAVGAMYKLLTNGEIPSGLATEQTARTAIGLRADGSAVFYTIDGKQSGLSVGASLTQVAMRLRELGCVEAIGLDGGGSTTIGTATPDETSFSITNSPSEGTQRANTNAIFFVSHLASDGVLSSIDLYPDSSYLLSGASTSLSVKGLDGGYYRTAVTGETSYDAAKGSVSGNVYTAPDTTGGSSTTDTITAQNGDMSASATVQIYTTPDEIRLYDQSTGERVTAVSSRAGTSVQLGAAAIKFGKTLTSQNSCYTWAVTGDCGSIDQNGFFTASGGTGSIVVSTGGMSVTIPVSIVGLTAQIEDFEDEPLFDRLSALSAAHNSDPNYVRYGSGSLAVSYQSAAGERAEMENSLGGWSLRPDALNNARYLGLWVYGDNSGNSLTLLGKNSDGSDAEVWLATLNFSGWRFLSATMPDALASFTGLRIGLDGSSTSGTIYLDQLVVSTQPTADTTAPSVSASVSGDTLTATVSDNADQSFEQTQISVSVDGQPIAFQFDGKTVTAQLSLDTALHRVRVTAQDQSGNLGFDSVQIGSSTAHFVDTGEHWSRQFAAYLYDSGISTGVPQSSGLYFYPDNRITRAEFFTLAARFLGEDLTQYDSVALPFADTASIPAYALSAIKAMYAKGYLQGVEQNGQLYVRAEREITRAEVMVILGRMQPWGYTEAELSAYSDAASVGDWARRYVQSLVGQGIVNGVNGALLPGNSITRGEVAKILTLMR